MRDGTAEPVHETKFSGTNGDRDMFIFPVQPTTNRIGNLTRLIHTLLYVMTIHTYWVRMVETRSVECQEHGSLTDVTVQIYEFDPNETQGCPSFFSLFLKKSCQQRTEYGI